MNTVKRWRRRLYHALEGGRSRDPLALWIRFIILALIIGSVATMMLETVPNLRTQSEVWLLEFEALATAIFTLEYIVRVWVAPEDRSGAFTETIAGRLKFMATPLALIDLAAILPGWIGLFWLLMIPGEVPPGQILLIARVFRLLRMLKLVRYSPALGTFMAVLRAERKTAQAAGILMLITLIFSATIIYILENEAQPEVFSSIPAGLWWAAVTMSTVGYGDMVPQTMLGRIFGSLVSVFGIALFTLPAAIIAAGFGSELRRRDYMLTASMLSHVPLFAALDTRQLAEVAGLLQNRVVPARHVVVRRAEVGREIIFVLAGEIEAVYTDGTIILHSGDSIGEESFLDDPHLHRLLHAHSLSDCRLAVLTADDLHHILERWPELQQQIAELAAAKLEDRRPHS